MNSSKILSLRFLPSARSRVNVVRALPGDRGHDQTGALWQHRSLLRATVWRQLTHLGAPFREIVWAFRRCRCQSSGIITEHAK